MPCLHDEEAVSLEMVLFSGRYPEAKIRQLREDCGQSRGLTT